MGDLPPREARPAQQPIERRIFLGRRPLSFRDQCRGGSAPSEYVGGDVRARVGTRRVEGHQFQQPINALFDHLRDDRTDASFLRRSDFGGGHLFLNGYDTHYMERGSTHTEASKAQMAAAQQYRRDLEKAKMLVALRALELKKSNTRENYLALDAAINALETLQASNLDGAINEAFAKGAVRSAQIQSGNPVPAVLTKMAALKKQEVSGDEVIAYIEKLLAEARTITEGEGGTKSGPETIAWIEERLAEGKALAEGLTQ